MFQHRTTHESQRHDSQDRTTLVRPTRQARRRTASVPATKSCNKFGSSVMLRIAPWRRLAHAWSKASPADPLQNGYSDPGVHHAQSSSGLVPGPTCPDRLGRCRRRAHRRDRQSFGVRSHHRCTDEIPNFQVLEREPIRRAIPGHIEQQEFEYTRHGTVNLLLFLVVHTGRMELTVLGANAAVHYIRALRLFRRRHRQLKGVFLVHDGGPSHIATATTDYLASCGVWWHPRLTPAHAS